ncbi:MAG: DUF4097 domain-containing protein [Chloroherpetonaceae bacterium]|nr:DUF4097 domain-containing protein [Chloroherpetonaceae bacterium]
MKNLVASLLLFLALHRTLFGGSLSDERTDIERTFFVQPGGSLQISISAGDIVVSVRDDNVVSIRAVGIDEDESNALKIAQSGNTVSVSYRPQRSSWPSRPSRLLRFEVSVPVMFNLELKSLAGDILLGETLLGSVRASSNYGDIRLHTVKGNVDLSATSGSISLEEAQGDGYVKTSGGDVRIGKVGGRLDVSTSGGTVRIGTAGNKLHVKTLGGHIYIDSVQGDAFLNTSGGDIRVQAAYSDLSASTSGGHITVKRATGKVDVKTSSGSIRLENIAGTISAHATAGNIYAELLPNAAGHSFLSTTFGDIELRVPESAKATIEAQVRDNSLSLSRLPYLHTLHRLREIDAFIQELRALRNSTDIDEHSLVIRFDTTIKLPLVRSGRIVDSLITGSAVIVRPNHFAHSSVLVIDSLRLKPVLITTPEGFGGSTIVVSIDSLRYVLTAGQLGALQKYLVKARAAQLDSLARAGGNSRSKASRILSDFEAQRTNGIDGSDDELTITLNGGGALISLQASQGKIRIKKLKR